MAAAEDADPWREGRSISRGARYLVSPGGDRALAVPVDGDGARLRAMDLSRNRSIGGPLDSLPWLTASVIAPEVQLLFKSNRIRQRTKPTFSQLRSPRASAGIALCARRAERSASRLAVMESARCKAEFMPDPRRGGSRRGSRSSHHCHLSGGAKHLHCYERASRHRAALRYWVHSGKRSRRSRSPFLPVLRGQRSFDSAPAPSAGMTNVLRPVSVVGSRAGRPDNKTGPRMVPTSSRITPLAARR